jgi:exopolysaccharide production protein ExoZ
LRSHFSAGLKGLVDPIPNKLEGLQAARAVAALAVAYFHSYVALRGFPESSQHPIAFLKDWGFLGVNFFFAISGYVICLVIAKPSFSLGSFAIKRLFRLYPMYWVAMALIAIMITAGKYRDEPLWHFLYSMTLLPQHGGPAYDVSWTLERELVFYALAAITVPVAGIPGLAVLLASLAYVGLEWGNPWSFHLASTQQADFLSGVLIYLFSSRMRLPNWAALLAIIAGAFSLWFTRTHEFPFAPTLCLSGILLGTVHLRLPWRHWSLSWIIRVGDASYSIYLLHYIVLFYSYWLSAQIDTLPAWLCEPWRMLTLAACCVISFGTWRLIERPAISLGNRIAEERPLAVRAPSNG